MEGLFPLNRIVAVGRFFSEEGEGLPSTSFDDRGNGDASLQLKKIDFFVIRY
jgi:hypothetical protein